MTVVCLLADFNGMWVMSLDSRKHKFSWAIKDKLLQFYSPFTRSLHGTRILVTTVRNRRHNGATNPMLVGCIVTVMLFEARLLPNGPRPQQIGIRDKAKRSVRSAKCNAPQSSAASKWYPVPKNRIKDNAKRSRPSVNVVLLEGRLLHGAGHGHRPPKKQNEAQGKPFCSNPY